MVGGYMKNLRKLQHWGGMWVLALDNRVTQPKFIIQLYIASFIRNTCSECRDDSVYTVH